MEQERGFLPGFLDMCLSIKGKVAIMLKRIGSLLVVLAVSVFVAGCGEAKKDAKKADPKGAPAAGAVDEKKAPEGGEKKAEEPEKKADEKK
jgi:hypothetical protein